MPSAKALDKKELWKDIERDARKKRRSVLVELRERLKAARLARRAAIAGAKKTCRDARAAARAKAAELEAQAKAERAKARGTCADGRESADVARASVKLSRAELEGETKHQRDMRRIEIANKARSKSARKAREKRDESDDEVRQNIPSDLIPLFERVKRGIKGSARISRTEAFLQYAEENPSEMLDVLEDKTDALIRELEARERQIAEEYEMDERRAVANPAGEIIKLGDLTRLTLRTESGRLRVLRWGLRSAPTLAYNPSGKRASLVIVYPVRVVGKAPSAAIKEYAKTHWGVSGAGERVDGERALTPLSRLGPAVSITYTTEKGGDLELVDYEHEFGDGAEGAWTPPVVLQHACGAKKCPADEMVALSGGTYRVTERGIVG